MLIEVTEKEAQGIYFDRFLDKRPKVIALLPIISITIGLIIMVVLNNRINDWLLCIIIMAIIIPGLSIWVKTILEASRNAKQELKQELREQTQ